MWGSGGNLVDRGVRAGGIRRGASRSAAAAEVGGIDVTSGAPDPGPAKARSYHVHDGFYLRVGLGTGPHWLSLDDDKTNTKAKTNSFDFAVDVLVGGSPSRGLAIGGALLFNALPSSELEVDGRKTGVTPDVGVAILGVFIDGFPNPKRGFHLGGALGLAAVNYSELESTNTSDSQETTGFGGAIWIGHDFWVADEWSIGPLLRFNSTVTAKSDDKVDLTTTTRALTLMLSGLYH